MIIKKIFEGVFDEEVHEGFLKFGRGEHKDKFLIEGKKQATKWAIKTSSEFSNFLVKNCLEKVSGNVVVRGIIVSTFEMASKAKFNVERTKKFMGIKQMVINTETDAGNILDLMEEFPRAFYALSFKGDDFELKIKAKPPKSAKPGKKAEGGAKAEFCRLKTTDEEILKELFFDVGLNWKEIKVNHVVIVDEIIYPKNVPAEEMREKSKRKGKIVRIVDVDGREVVREAEFEV